MSLAFGTAVNAAGTTVASQAVTLSDAAAAGDWIVVFATIATTAAHSNSQGSVSTVTSTGTVLTFTKRKALGLVAASSNWLDVEEWWAPVSSTINAGTLVVTAAFNQTCDDCNVAVVKVTGTPTGWDPNAALPATGQNTASTTPAVTGVSTTEVDTLTFIVMGALTTGIFGIPAGWTQLFTNDSAGGANFNTITVVYKLFVAAQTNQTYTSTSTATGNWSAIADAITSDALTTAKPQQPSPICVISG